MTAVLLKALLVLEDRCHLLLPLTPRHQRVRHVVQHEVEELVRILVVFTVFSEVADVAGWGRFGDGS